MCAELTGRQKLRFLVYFSTVTFKQAKAVSICSKSAIETLEEGANYLQSFNNEEQ